MSLYQIIVSEYQSKYVIQAEDLKDAHKKAKKELTKTNNISGNLYRGMGFVRELISIEKVKV